MARTKKPLVKVCMWTPDESVWETACGESFQFMECDGPKVNGMKFCCYCGLPLREHHERKRGPR